MAPVVLALRRVPGLSVKLMLSGQHRELARQALATFGLQSDMVLDVMRPDQTLAGLTRRLFLELEQVLKTEAPDVVVAQGDTTTVMVAALCCFYAGIAFAHVEAGLRTGDLQNPFPEELNRVVVGHIARLNFAPTARAKAALLGEGADPATVFVTGNSVIDALRIVEAQIEDDPTPEVGVSPHRTLLLTIHRRENFGIPMERICRAVLAIVQRFPDVLVNFPVHPNPNVRKVVEQHLADHPKVRLTEPLEYNDLVTAMRRAHIVLTDSGGIQEEAPALGKPVLILREKTERPEAVESGVAKLIGTDEQDVVGAVAELLTSDAAYKAMARGISPYGDGFAGRRIATLIGGFLKGEAVDVDEFVTA